MNRTDRLVAMVMYFQGRRLVRAEELAEHFEVSVRTVYRDVAALSEAGVPVTGEAGVGYSLVKGYHLPPVMFTGEEAMALFVGGEMVKMFTDASLSAPMSSAVLKLRAVLPREQQDDVDRLSRGMLVAGKGALRQGLDQRVLMPIQQAVVSRRVLKLRYRGLNRNEETDREVEPLGVAFYNGAWYLVGWCRLRGELRQFKLERVKALEVSAERFGARPDFSLVQHMDETTSSMQLTMARVWFGPFVYDRARRESYGEFTQVIEVRGGFEVTLGTFSLKWLARWLLAFGDEIHAIDPPELRQLIAAQARRVAERHDSKVAKLEDAPSTSESDQRERHSRRVSPPAAEVAVTDDVD